MNRERDEMEIDLLEIFYILKKRVLVILLTAVIFAAASGIYSFFIADPVYESTSRLYILTQSTSITSLADIQMGSSLAQDYLELIKSRPVVEDVIDNLNLDLEYEQMVGKVTVTNPADTRILNISVQDTDAATATRAANEFSKVAKKQISNIMKTDEPSVVEVATTPDAPIKPEKAKNVLIGFLLGAILSAIVIIAMYLLNDSIKSQDDIERYLGINMLAAVPMDGKKKEKHHKSKKSKKSRGRK